MIITVAIAFKLQTDEGQMLHFEPGQHDVPPEIAEHWYTRASLVGGPVQRDADERAAAHQAYRDRSPREAGDAGLPEDPRSPRDRLMDAARAASLVPEPQQRRRGVLGLVRERLRLGRFDRFGDLKADPEFLCTVSELIADYPDGPDAYWSWIDAEQPAAVTGIAVELFLAIHAAPKHQLVRAYQRTLMESPLVRQILFRPGATLRDGLLALAAHPDCGYLVGAELRVFLLPSPAPTASPGRPTPMPLIMQEWERIAGSKEPLEKDSIAQARGLARWLTDHHPKVRPVRAETIQRRISASFEKAKQNR